MATTTATDVRRSSSGGLFVADDCAVLKDNIPLYFGDDLDVWLKYDTSSGELETNAVLSSTAGFHMDDDDTFAYGTDSDVTAEWDTAGSPDSLLFLGKALSGAKIQFTGGTGAATSAGGAVGMTGGAGGATSGTGGTVAVTGGAGTNGNATGGTSSTVGGAGQGSAGGGDGLLTGGVSGATGTGGAATVTSGASVGASGTAGDVNIDCGALAGGTGGDIEIGASNAVNTNVGTDVVLASGKVLDVTDGGSATVSSGTGTVKMGGTNNANNTKWIPLAYAGTTCFVPAWAAHSP